MKHLSRQTRGNTTSRMVMVTAVVAALALVGGCASSKDTASSSPPKQSSAAAPDPAYAAALKPELEKLAKEMLVTGSVVMVRSPKLGNWTTTIGTRTYKGSEAVQPTDHIRIGSVTKTWTGTVILQLVDEGKIALSDPVSKYQAGVPNGENITIAQLLSMRSGLYNYTKSLALNQEMDKNPDRAFKPEELLKIAYAEPASFPPGERFEYSNTNIVILGLIIEKLTGKPVAEAFKTRIFDKVGMKESSFPSVTDSELPSPHPQGYTYGTNVDTVDSPVLPESVQAAAQAGTLAPMDVTNANPSWGWTAGSGISTAGDLVKYADALVDGELLSPKLQKQRLDSVLPVDPSAPEGPGYGLGIAKFGALYGHTGELPGFNTFVGHDPVRDITIIVWTSLEPSPAGEAPATDLARTIIEALYPA